MTNLSPSWRPLLEAILEHPDGMSLQDIAAAAGLSPSATHQHLRAMARVQFIERVGERKNALYRPLPVSQGLWIMPTGRDRLKPLRPWKIVEWNAIGWFSQQFPLVNRILDAEGRLTAERFLKRTLERGLLTPWLLPVPEETIQRRELNVGEAENFRANFKNPSNHTGLMFIAYGSCVRGDSRKGSDLDLLVVTPNIEFAPDNDRKRMQTAIPDLDWNNRLQDLASEINLGSPRTIDLRTVSFDDFHSLSANLQKAILKEGVTIYSSVEGGQWVESWGENDG